MCHYENYKVSQNSLEDTHVQVMYVCEPLMFLGAHILYTNMAVTCLLYAHFQNKSTS
jgi:hypothetical protein